MSMQQNFLEFSKPFVNAAKNVFETMVFTKLEPQKPILKTTNSSQGDISAVIGINGTIDKEGGCPYKGMLVITWPYATYTKMASAMLMEKHEKFCPEIADVGGEICNMIMGNAKRELKELGYSTDMAIPSMVEGANHNISYLSNTTVISIPIQSAHGTFYMELCFKQIQTIKK